MSGLKEFLKRSTPTDWIQTLFGIPVFVVAVYALIGANEAQEDAQLAAEFAEGNSLGVRGVVEPIVRSEQEDVAIPAPDAMVVEGSGASLDPRTYILQMASYRKRNCQIAQAEVDAYGDEFGAKPKLWLSATQAYVVVGLKADTRDQATLFKARALELSLDERFKNEDLPNAKIQIDPNWTSITNCADVPEN